MELDLQHNPSLLQAHHVRSSHFSASVMSYFGRDYEALLAAALTGFTGAVQGREDKKNLIIRWASQSGNTSIPSKYPTMQIWKPILASCTEPSTDTIRNLEAYYFHCIFAITVA